MTHAKCIVKMPYTWHAKSKCDWLSSETSWSFPSIRPKRRKPWRNEFQIIHRRRTSPTSIIHGLTKFMSLIKPTTPRSHIRPWRRRRNPATPEHALVQTSNTIFRVNPRSPLLNQTLYGQRHHHHRRTAEIPFLHQLHHRGTGYEQRGRDCGGSRTKISVFDKGNDRKR